MTDVPAIQSRPTTCALCLREAVLRSSHIIPEFAFKPIYDEKHRMHAIPGHAPDENFWLQKGLRYPLLCDTCESFINTNYEDPFKRFWVDGHQLATMRAARQNIITSIDYRTFKLFHLSVVWRAAVCKNPAFNLVSLGPDAEKIRTMLLKHDPGPASLYPMICGVIIDDDNGYICDGIVTTPLSLTLWGHCGFDFVYCGCQWLFFFSSHPMREIEQIQLSEQGTMIVDNVSLKRVLQNFYSVSRGLTQRYGYIDAKRVLASSPK